MAADDTKHALRLYAVVAPYKIVYFFTYKQAAIIGSCIYPMGYQHYPAFRDSYARFPPLIVVVLA